LTPDELAVAGCNQSIGHTDFMFGSKDMQVKGTQKNGTKIIIFKDGDFVI
jgi:aminopeptidase